MADAVAETRTDERNASPWRAVGIFLLLTICLTGVFWALIIATQTAYATYIYGAMWMPALESLVASQTFHQRSARLRRTPRLRHEGYVHHRQHMFRSAHFSWAFSVICRRPIQS